MLLSSYNNSYHRSIKTLPTKVNLKNQNRIFYNLYGFYKKDGEQNLIKFKFKIGDYVRISIDKNLFEKGYTPNWSREIYIIDKIIPQQYPIYKINSLNGEELDTYYYDNELQKVYTQEFPYDTFEILKETESEYLVKQLNTESPDIEKWINK